ncbi:hypothetical protein DVA85_16175 [Acinetobacter sp. RIT592]|nr:hypothetical protein DVA85_16175 [Acinetobacter sp. RIT592]
MVSRVFFSFSSTDIKQYYLMKAWKKNPNTDFTFIDYQLPTVIRSENIPYIKKVCKERIDSVSTFVLLIGEDTKLKTTFVKYEVECAVKKGCRLFALNLNNSRRSDELCPDFIKNLGFVFLPYSQKALIYCLENISKQEAGKNYVLSDSTYKMLGL